VPELGVHVLEDVPSMPFFGELGLNVPLAGPVPMQFASLTSQSLMQLGPRSKTGRCSL
jgi:hypothetical protein